MELTQKRYILFFFSYQDLSLICGKMQAIQENLNLNSIPWKQVLQRKYMPGKRNSIIADRWLGENCRQGR